MDDLSKEINSEDNNNNENDKKIGDYILNHTIGKGTFGKVKIGQHIPTKEIVAIKILEKNKITDKDDMIRIERELKICKSLNHLNIIKIFDILEDQQKYYIIMEHAKGGELFNYILNKRRLSEQESSYFFYQIINGIEHMHKNNVVHRDLKPENLLLTEEKILKIIDFGLSNEFAAGSLLQTPCGSPCYAAPEMVVGKRYSGVKIDIWSCGIILYAMTCGYLPFEDKKNEILFRKIIECDYELPGFLNRNVKDLIKKILVTNPRNRPNIEDIKKHNFYKQGKMIFIREHKFCFEIIMKGNLEIEKMINEKLIFEFKQKLNKKLTIEDIESLKKRGGEKEINKKDHCNLKECDADFFYDSNQETPEEGNPYNDKMKIKEDKEKIESQDESDEIIKERKLNNKFSQKDFAMHEKIDSSKLKASYEILYNNLLKNKEFFNDLIAKLPAEIKENDIDDRETRRSNSITNNQFCFGQPKINININCIKQVENLNVNIAPIVSISSVPYSPKFSKSKENSGQIKSKPLNNINNYSVNYNTIANSNEIKNKNTSQFVKKDLNNNNNQNKSKNLSVNKKNNVNNVDLSLNIIKNKNNGEKNNTIILDHLLSIDAIFGNLKQKNSNNINSTRNKVEKQTTFEKNRIQNNENLNTMDTKSLYSQFQDCKINFYSRCNNKHVNTLKKNNDLDSLKQLSTSNTNNPSINPYINPANGIYSSMKNEGLNIKPNPYSARNKEKYETIDSVDNMNSSNSPVNKNLKAVDILNKKRNEFSKLRKPIKTDLSNYLYNKGFANENTINTKNVSNSKNQTTDSNANYKHPIFKNKKENSNKNNINDSNNNRRKLSETFNNKINNTIMTNNKTNYATINTEKKTVEKTSYSTNENKELIDFKHNNHNEQISNKFSDLIYEKNSRDIEIMEKSERKKSESLKITEIQRFYSTPKHNINEENCKNPSKSKNLISSIDRLFAQYPSYNKNTQFFDECKKPNYHKNSFSIFNYHAKDFSTLILKSNHNTNNLLKSFFKNETININSHINNDNRAIQSESRLKAGEITTEDCKVRRLRRIVKDSLGSFNYAYDASSLQTPESPKAKNVNSIITKNKDNQLKIPLRQSKTICTNNVHNENNFIEKLKGNLSSRVENAKKFSIENYDRRALSKPKGVNGKSFQVKSAFQNNNKVKDFNEKGNRVNKEFESLYKKVSENIKPKSEINYKTLNANKINNKIGEDNKRNKKTTNYLNNKTKSLINTIDIDLNEIRPRAISKKSYDRFSKLSSISKTNKETLQNKYVTLDLFEFTDENIESKQLDKIIKQSSKAKIKQNSFKTRVNFDKRSLNEKVGNDNLTSGVNNFIKFSLFSNLVSNSKINLSSVPSLKK